MIATKESLRDDLSDAFHSAVDGSYDQAIEWIKCAMSHVEDMRLEATRKSGSGSPGPEVPEVEVGKRVDLEVEARAWLEDCGADPDDLEERDTLEVFQEVDRLYEGGYSEFLVSFGI